MAFLIERPIPERPYFKVGEVAQILGVAPSTVRYWQKEFPDHIHPELSMAGQNVFSRNDVITMAVIMNLVRIDGVSLKDARIALTRIIQEHDGNIADIRLCRQFNLDLGLEQGDCTDLPVTEPQTEPSPSGQPNASMGESGDSSAQANADVGTVAAGPADPEAGRTQTDSHLAGCVAELSETVQGLQNEVQLLEDENIRLREQIARNREDLNRSAQEAMEHAARLRILQEQVYAITANMLESLDCGHD